MKSFKLELYDAEGTVKETWTLNNAFIKAAKYGDMDYANDDLRQISLTIKYDWARLETKGKAAAGDGQTSFFNA